MVSAGMRFAQPAPDVYTASTYLGPIRWLGLPFALASLMPLSGALGLVEVQMEGGGEAPTLFLVLFAMPFLGIGLGLMFWKREITVDRRTGEVHKLAGLFVPFQRRVRKLDSFEAAVHDKRVIRGQKSNRTVYPVLLETPGGGGFELLHCRNKRQARAVAEWLARHGGYAVVDRTSGTDQRREFADIDTSLRARRERDGERPEPGAPPAKMRSRLDARDGAITIEIPAHGMQPLLVIGMLFATAPIWMAMLFLSMGHDDGSPDGWFVALAYAMPSAITLGLWTVLVYHGLRRFTVRASNDELRVQQAGLLRRSTVIPADEIEELHVDEDGGGFDAFLGGGPPITITSDHAEVAFGQTLKQKESAYLAEVLRCALSA